MFLPQWNWVFGGGYIWISGTGWTGVHNTVFLVIKCEVLHLNENIMFRLNLLAYSQYVLYISFAPWGYFFMKRPHSGHLLVKMWQGWGPSSYMRPKFMVFLDSQILSGIYFYHWHLMNCKILHLIIILSTEFFAIFPYMPKTGNNEKYGFKWPILGPFFVLLQKITVIFEIICYFLLSFIHLNKIRPNSHEF